jgi:hypothetical protein
VTTWITTALVAIVVALAVPATQLRIAADDAACCCPDPTTCRCSDHEADPSSPSLRACHRPERALVAPELPVFSPPAVVVAAAPALAIVAVAHAVTAPHPPPAPARPDAPS